jgi:hypothetical protein
MNETGQLYNCSDYPDLPNIIGDITLNFTTLAKVCPGVCSIVIGTGNPDLSGIGVRIGLPTIENKEAKHKYLYLHGQAITSYLIQAVFGVICLLRVVAEVFSTAAGNENHIELSRRFIFTQTMFTASVLIASIIQRRQPIFYLEDTLLTFVGFFQLQLQLSISITNHISRSCSRHTQNCIPGLKRLLDDLKTQIRDIRHPQRLNIVEAPIDSPETSTVTKAPIIGTGSGYALFTLSLTLFLYSQTQTRNEIWLPLDIPRACDVPDLGSMDLQTILTAMGISTLCFSSLLFLLHSTIGRE